MSDWPNEDEPEDLISLTDLDEDGLNLLTEIVFGTQDNKKYLKKLSERLKKNFVILDEREREILALRCGLDRGEPRTLEEVGEAFNLTRDRIRQIEARAWSKLRHANLDTGEDELKSV